ncbi:MAG: TonB-dependent receptor [Chitinophagales bacterium]
MKRIFTSLLLAVISISAYAQSGEIYGQVLDENNEGIPFANVRVEQSGDLITGGSTDFEGFFTIKPLNPGKYDVRITYIGYATYLNEGVVVQSDKVTELNLKMKPQETQLGEVEVVEYRVPLIDKDDNSTKNTISSEEIASLPTRNVSSIASTSAGVYQEDENQGLNIKGARTSGTETYIDGIRVRGGSNIPANAIEQLTVITGGVPAKYGNATGGVINITTKGPSRNLNGGGEVLTSQFLDGYGYNLGNLNLTGPIWKKNRGTDDEKTIAGFFLAGEFLRQKDRDPSVVGVDVLKEDVLEDVKNAPLTRSPNNDGFILKAETLTDEHIENVHVKPNSVRDNYRLSGKLDFKASDNVNLTFGGTMDYTRYNQWINRFTMMNYDNNPLYKQMSWRVFGRLTQKFSRDTEESEERALIQNAYYTLQFDYSKDYYTVESERLGQNPFDYGYVGEFEIDRAPVYEYGEDPVSGLNGYRFSGLQDTMVRFTPGTRNPGATSYTETFYELAGDDADFYRNLDQIAGNNGLRNGDQPRIPHGIWYGTGYQFDNYGTLRDNDQYRFSLNGSFDVVPGKSSDRNKHSIEFGFEFEQRIDRRYIVSPTRIWERMRQQTNAHLSNLDTVPILIIEGQEYAYDDPNRPVFGIYDTMRYNRLYDASSQTYFDKQLREKLGVPVNSTELINVDAVDPSILSLDMLTADDLYNAGNRNLNAYGYDHKGNKFKEQPSFEDFFTQRDEDGNYTRAIGAFRPIYTAAYLQDKFNFKDILFNIGVRIDRYDANQKVLKDKYSLYDALTLEEARDRIDPSVEVPGNIGDDYVVYVQSVDDLENFVPVGYRSGDDWYNVDGEFVQDPRVIAQSIGSSRVLPALSSERYTNPQHIQDEDYDPNSSFEDYKPQITVQPRVAFSFNLTDEASFFAHYDILTQRPSGRLIQTPDTWYYFNDLPSNTVINNPNLKAERTVDYQLGFRQLVTKNSALTISAFYREMRDMIQVRAINFAYPNTYVTYDNIDYGTVKGLSLSYDLRKTRTSNISMKLNYTLQFAEGTGSDDRSQLNLVNAGQPNLRTIVPLNYDSRHLINVTLDYSFSSGRDYNGPKWGGKDVFSNSGINIIARARSGEPYTSQANPTAEALFTQPARPVLEGSINGARLPWNFRLDFRVFKTFNFETRKKDENRSGRPVNLNIYLLIQNLLNTKNVINVYPYTGNADDDGYLTSNQGQQQLENQVNSASFSSMYYAWLNNPDNYSLPRQIRLGAILSF